MLNLSNFSELEFRVVLKFFSSVKDIPSENQRNMLKTLFMSSFIIKESKNKYSVGSSKVNLKAIQLLKLFLN